MFCDYKRAHNNASFYGFKRHIIDNHTEINVEVENWDVYCEERKTMKEISAACNSVKLVLVYKCDFWESPQNKHRLLLTLGLQKKKPLNP